MTHQESKIGFLFHMGHGHAAQFLNFKEAFPPEELHRAVWIPLEGETSGDALANLKFLPHGPRYRRNRLWHVQQVINSYPEWDALFFAAEQLNFTGLARRYRSYLYTDFTPSTKRELAPWYNHQLSSNPVINALRARMWTRFFHACRGVFTMSEWAARGVRGDYAVPDERVHVVLPGANLDRWDFVDRSDRLDSRPTRILMVGGDFERKGGQFLLDWAGRTKAQNWELDIVTWPGELADWMQETLGRPAPDARVSGSLAPRLPHVRVHCGLRANTPEMMQLFAEADVFALPTQADGSSIASLEAMASGLPVLVGAVGEFPN